VNDGAWLSRRSHILQSDMAYKIKIYEFMVFLLCSLVITPLDHLDASSIIIEYKIADRSDENVQFGNVQDKYLSISSYFDWNWYVRAD